MSVNPGMLSSERSDWETPDDLFAALHREFAFTVDAAAIEKNSKLEEFFGPPEEIEALYVAEARARELAVEARKAGRRAEEGTQLGEARRYHRELLAAQRASLAEVQWDAVSFLNPPYGDELPVWLEKCVAEAARGCTVVALVPARTDTDWWVRFANQARERREIRGRLRFKGAEASAPFPSAVLVFRPEADPSPRRLVTIGTDGRVEAVVFDCQDLGHPRPVETPTSDFSGKGEAGAGSELPEIPDMVLACGHRVPASLGFHETEAPAAPVASCGPESTAYWRSQVTDLAVDLGLGEAGVEAVASAACINTRALSEFMAVELMTAMREFARGRASAQADDARVRKLQADLDTAREDLRAYRAQRDEQGDMLQRVELLLDDARTAPATKAKALAAEAYKALRGELAGAVAPTNTGG